MRGEERMKAIVTAIIAAACLGAIGFGYKACARDKQMDELIQANDAQIRRTCLERGGTASVCLGHIGVTHCEPSTSK